MVRQISVLVLTALVLGCSRSEVPKSEISIDSRLALPQATTGGYPSGPDSNAFTSIEQTSMKILEDSLQSKFSSITQDAAELEKLISPSLKELLGNGSISPDFLKHVKLVPGSLTVDTSGRATAKLQFQSKGSLYMAYDGTKFRASHFSVGAVDSMQPVVNVPIGIHDVGQLLRHLETDPMQLQKLQIVVDSIEHPLWEFCGVTWSDFKNSATAQLKIECHGRSW